MTKKKKRSPWRAAFLRALARLGNVRAAAEAAGVDASTAYSHRKGDERFAARWDAAREKAKEAPPPPCRRSPSPRKRGEELVARYSKRHGVQMVRAGAGRWSPKAEAVYLAHLRTTGCLRRAAAGAGFSSNAVDYRRKRYPAFAAECEAALEESLVQLRSLVAAAGIAAFDPFPEALPEGGGAAEGYGGRGDCDLEVEGWLGFAGDEREGEQSARGARRGSGAGGDSAQARRDGGA